MNPPDDVIREALTRFKRVAVVGLSADPSRASHGVTRFLISAGYEVCGVRPGSQEILGLTCYDRPANVPGGLEIIDVFRASEFVPALVEELLPLRPKMLWLQEGVTDRAAEQKARDAGILVVSDLCIYKEHRRLRVAA